MSVELPYAPVDTLIREAAPDIRVSQDASEKLALEIQERGAELAVDAAENARRDGRKTVMPEDFRFTAPAAAKDELTLPIAPIDRIARLRIEDYRVSQDARLILASHLEDWAREAASNAAKLARHAGRRTLQAEDIEVYFEVQGAG